MLPAFYCLLRKEKNNSGDMYEMWKLLCISIHSTLQNMTFLPSRLALDQLIYKKNILNIYLSIYLSISVRS